MGKITANGKEFSWSFLGTVLGALVLLGGCLGFTVHSYIQTDTAELSKTVAVHESRITKVEQQVQQNNEDTKDQLNRIESQLQSQNDKSDKILTLMITNKTK
jgi:predicted PurR-regulated permease PerM